MGVFEDVAEQEPAKRFTVTGVKDADKMCKDLWNTLNSSEKVNVNLLKDEDVQIVRVQGKDVIVVNVPRADCSLRPIYINNNMLRGSFRRGHAGDYRCPEPMTRMMVRDSFDDGNDRLFLEHYNMDDIDIPSLAGYRVMFELRNQGHVWNGLEHKEFLTQLGGYVVNKDEGTEGLTMAGLLMFGKGLPVRERFDNFYMDYIDKSNLIGDQRYSDRLTYDGTWENNLFNFIRIVLPRLTRDLPRPFKMEGIIRIDDTPQHKAVREAFTNMIIHADLMTRGLLRVEKYDDRFVLTNPGLLMLPLERIYSGGESRARNLRIQKMLRMIGYGENIGSGFPLIISAWDEKKWIRPELIEEPELMQVKLVLYINGEKDGIKDPENVTKGGTENVTKDVTKELTERQRVILDLIKRDKMITIPEMSRKTNVTERTIKRDIEFLIKKNILSREGGRKEGVWVVK